jgi:hypothetical protein
MHRLRELAASIGDLRLPKNERGAAKAERAEEARIRRERDYAHGAEKRHAAADAERHRYGGGSPRQGGGRHVETGAQPPNPQRLSSERRGSRSTERACELG